MSAAARRRVSSSDVTRGAGFYAGYAGALGLGEEWHHNRLTMVARMQGWGVGVDRKRLRSDALELFAGGRLRVDELLSERAAFGSAPQLFAGSRSNQVRRSGPF